MSSYPPSPGAPVLVCPAGHGAPPVPGGAFCPLCGAALVTLPGAPAAPPPVVTGARPSLSTCADCGGTGAGLPASVVMCPTCRWLRPLAPGYSVEPSAFMWAQDGAAMARLRSIGPLTAAARAVSDRAGRPWVESTFNGVLLSERQLPDLFALAVRAARLLAMPVMPQVYITGDKMWESATFGSDHSAFILIGTALVNSFRGEDLLFVLAREMGHCRAGHALWKTVGTFLMGEQGPRRGMLAGGVLQALDPARVIGGAIEMPLLAWARQSEITADRAGLLAVGSEEVARRVLLSWSLRSAALYQRINLEAWLQQQDDQDDQMTRFSEMMSSPTPYITRRLRLLRGFAASPELARARAVIAPLDPGPIPDSAAPARPPRRPPPPPLPLLPPARSAPPPATPPAPSSPVPGLSDFLLSEPPPRAPIPPPTSAAAPAPPDFVRLACPACRGALRFPRALLRQREVLALRCPHAGCGKVTTLRRVPASTPPPAPPATPTLSPDPETLHE